MSESPLKDAAEGAAKGITEGVLKFAKEEIPSLIARFRNKDLAFLRDSQAIQAVRKERSLPSWKLVEPFITDLKLRIQVQTGFGLRDIVGDKRRLEEVRLRILKTYGTAGLHVGELAESGIISELLTRLIGVYGSSTVDVQRAMTAFLSNSERLAIWVHQSTNVENTISSCVIRLESSDPHLILLFAKGHMRRKLSKIVRGLSLKGFIMEQTLAGDELTVFVYTKEARRRTSHWSDFLVKSEP